MKRQIAVLACAALLGGCESGGQVGGVGGDYAAEHRIRALEFNQWQQQMNTPVYQPTRFPQQQYGTLRMRGY